MKKLECQVFVYPEILSGIKCRYEATKFFVREISDINDTIVMCNKKYHADPTCFATPFKEVSYEEYCIWLLLNQ
jgi:hypothetical protein